MLRIPVFLIPQDQ